MRSEVFVNAVNDAESDESEDEDEGNESQVRVKMTLLNGHNKLYIPCCVYGTFGPQKNIAMIYLLQ